MKLLYLALLSFIFISTTAISLSGIKDEYLVDKIPFVFNSKKTFSKIPVLKEGYSSFPVLSAQSAIAVDMDSGVYLYEKDPFKPLLPASTTKIVTAMVALETFPTDMVTTIGTIKIEGQKMGLVAGEKLRVIDLLYGLLVYSANDAAEALAQIYPPGREEFINLMNKKATDLGLRNTHFSNPSGLDSSTHYSTAKDLIILSRNAMKNPVFSEIVATKAIDIKSVDGKITHRLTNINKLLGTVDGVKGVKTGWTENARENLVTYIERDGKKIMIAVLGSQDRFGETKELISWIFDNYNWDEVRVTYSP